MTETNVETIQRIRDQVFTDGTHEHIALTAAIDALSTTPEELLAMKLYQSDAKNWFGGVVDVEGKNVEVVARYLRAGDISMDSALRKVLDSPYEQREALASAIRCIAKVKSKLDAEVVGYQVFTTYDEHSAVLEDMLEGMKEVQS